MRNERTLREIRRSMMIRRRAKTAVMTFIIFSIAIFYFFPILYMFLSGFKNEFQAVSPTLFFTPTLETYAKVLSDRNIYGYLSNSFFQVLAGTIFCLILGMPAAFILVFGKFRKPESNEKIYMWFITTILLPPVAVLIPLYTWFQTFGLNKTPLGLLIAYIGFHVPIVVWMLHSFVSDIPGEIIEASEIDGCTRMQQLLFMVIPLARTGIIASGLLVAVFIWNEFFLGFNLTGNTTATLPVKMGRAHV